MIPMPLPTHMSCFKQWAESDKSYAGICGMFKSKKKNQSNSLVFGEEYGLEDFDSLIPPGLLLHHVTPMKDYIHDHLKPWIHYIPVSADLKDLKQKFLWAEAHPQEAKKIADASTEFMKELGTPQGFEKLYEQDFVEPLRRVIEAYQPVSIAHFQSSQADRLHSPDKTSKLNSKSWRNVLEALDTDFLPVMECPGTASRNQCLWKLSEQEIKAW